ncbi:hypothetical protein CGMCC3_g9852 [Colletotrichum fructicola]|nr:uncharacterized protein CGMCC3_g9852 [Colletotrichum fructicola]KAE9574202.1 hypothetical protein CGMCC3_g9852 [Colletotrichum fructicola]KAF4430887.1 hypothetical protein CFRS1_v009602 [Colletotrichum fructicola]
MLIKLTFLIILGFAHLCLDGLLLSSYSENDSIMVIQFNATQLASNIVGLRPGRLSYNLTDSLPTNLTIGVWNACIGFRAKYQCWAFHELGSEFEGALAIGLDAVRSKVTQIITPEYLVLADAGSTILLLCCCCFIILFSLRKVVMWCVMVATVFFLAPVIILIVVIYYLRSTFGELGLHVEVGIAGVFSIVAFACSVISLLIGLVELLI